MIVKENQNIFDITIQEFGTLENLFDFLQDNSLELNSKLKGSQDVIVNNIGKGNESVKNFVILNNISYNNDQIPGGSYSNDYSNDYN